MTFRRTLLPLLALALALGLAACGGGSKAAEDTGPTAADVPANAIAIVEGTPVPKTDFDAVWKQVEASYEQQKKKVPAVGTAEYQSLRENVVQYLTERVAFRDAAKKLGVTVSDEDVQKQLEQVKKQYFDGDDAKFEKALDQQGFTLASYEDTLRDQLLSQKLYDAVTKDVTVTDDDIAAYYKANKSQFEQPAKRDVRHILFACTKQAACEKAKAQAEQVRAELLKTGDWKGLAKRYSDDPGSKDKGGLYEDVAKGSFVSEFDAYMFSAEAGKISPPIKTEFGYHLIEPLGKITPGKTTPLDQVKDSIRSTLEKQKKDAKMTEWVKDLRTRYRADSAFAAGYRLPAEQTTTGASTGAATGSTG